MKKNAPSTETDYRFWFRKVCFLLGWAIPFCIAFVAYIIWQGLVIGWATAEGVFKETL